MNHGFKTETSDFKSVKLLKLFHLFIYSVYSQFLYFWLTDLSPRGLVPQLDSSLYDLHLTTYPIDQIIIPAMICFTYLSSGQIY